MTKPSNILTVRPTKSQISLRSDWVDAHADLSLRWAHMPFCWFCHEAAQVCRKTLKRISFNMEIRFLKKKRVCINNTRGLLSDNLPKYILKRITTIPVINLLFNNWPASYKSLNFTYQVLRKAKFIIVAFAKHAVVSRPYTIICATSSHVS